MSRQIQAANAASPPHPRVSHPVKTRVVLITGAAGGLGRGLVAEFAAQGWRVAAACHEIPSNAETKHLWPIHLDVTDRAQTRDCIRWVIRRWRRIDALVNNAGVIADDLVSRMSDPDWNRVLDVNLKGAFLCSQAVLKSMVGQRDGHILNIASFSARSGPRGQANYAAAKAGLIGLTQSLAMEAGSHNVRVNAICPGVLPTALTAGLTRAQLTELAGANALGRLNSISEVARFVVFLATTHDISGQLFQLDSRIGPWT